MKPQLLKLLTVIAFLLLAGCSAEKYRTTNKLYRTQVKAFSKVLSQAPPVAAGQTDSLQLAKDWAGSVNFGMRRPNFVIIHHTAEKSLDQTIRTFTLTRTAVSAHYVIGDDGTVQHMVNDFLRAQHAGVSKWGNVIDLNSVSIGIELDNDGYEPFSEAQISSLLKLLGNLKAVYTIPTPNFIGHADIAPKRKPDPHQLFPWKRLADKGFGLWYSDSVATAPVTLDAMLALRVIGYDTSNPEAAITAFKRHFIQTDITPVLTQRDLDVLNDLYRRYF